MLFNITILVEDRNCYEKLHELRWQEGVKRPHCKSSNYKRHGYHNNCEHRYRYQCKSCHKYFDDLTNTIFEGHHQPLKVWIRCLYLMSLNLSNLQIAHELGSGEYARDEDGDGKYEVHVNTMEGFWSLLRSWLRPHRGISQEKMLYYLSFLNFYTIFVNVDKPRCYH
jgi:transposase-like protein